MSQRSAAALLLGLLAGCNTASGDSAFFGKLEPPEGQVLRYISGSEPESLDPQLSSGQPELRLYMALYDGLVEFNPKTGQPIPAIARSWEVNGNATELLFHLRPDARFSNGERITANDFVYVFRRAVTPELASRSAYLAYQVKYAQAFNEGGMFVRDRRSGEFVADPDALADGSGEAEIGDTPFHHFMHAPARLVVPPDDSSRNELFKTKPQLRALVAGKELVPVRAEDVGVEAMNDSTFRLTLQEPAPYFLGLLTHQLFRAIHRKTVEKYGNQWTRPANIVTSGPFKLITHRPYNEIVVRRNPMYWDAASVKLDQISFYPLEDQTTIINLYTSGEVDATYNHTVPASWLKSGLRSKKDYMDAPENAIEYYQINITKPPMNDVRVRKAFNMAIDKVALAQYRVVTKPLTAFTPEGIFPGYPRTTGDEFNPARTRELLAEAGYRDASGNFDPKKFPVNQVSINYNTSESNKQVAEFVQAQWKQNLGLTVPLNNSEWKTYLTMRAKLEYSGFARS